MKTTLSELVIVMALLTFAATYGLTRVYAETESTDATHTVTITDLDDVYYAHGTPSVSIKGADWLYVVFENKHYQPIEVYARGTVVIEPVREEPSNE